MSLLKPVQTIKGTISVKGSLMSNKKKNSRQEMSRDDIECNNPNTLEFSIIFRD